MTLKDQLIRDEGYAPKLYFDTLNVPTIGIGRNLQRPLSYDEVDYLFRNDLNNTTNELVDSLPWVIQLGEIRLAALINMAFNLGVPKLLSFHNMLEALRAGKWTLASQHALNSVWANQVGPRAQRIAKQLETGEWQ